MVATIADIIRVMDMLAPSRLAEKWDNAGLQVGQRDWPVKTIVVALDPSADVVADACKKGADLLITHHPLIFKPLKSLDLSTPMGSVIHQAIQHRLAIFAAHTNLDSATGGINDLLASKIGLGKLNVLERPIAPEICKLVIYVPAEHEQKVLNALFETQAGRIGEYSCCSFRNKGQGTFRPGALAKPFVGEIGKISHADEIRIESVVLKNDLANVIRHVKERHPYETMAHDVYDIQNPQEGQEGLGRVGSLDKDTDLGSYSLEIKRKLGLRSLKVAGKPELIVRRVAVCSGSGSSLMNAFFSSGAAVYVSGDLRYHDAMDAVSAGRGLIDIGHFASEHLIVEVLADRLRRHLSQAWTDIRVETCGFENDPFMIV